MKKNPLLLLRFPDPLCSTCDALASALSEAAPSDSSSKSASALDEDCRSCCTPDDEGDGSSSSSAASFASDSSLPKASSAILEVCRSRLRAHRHVDEFVKHKLKLFGGQVKLRDRYGSPPRIYFLDARGKRVSASGTGGGSGAASPVRVDHWRTEDIESFLRERLVEDFKGKGKKESRSSSASA